MRAAGLHPDAPFRSRLSPAGAALHGSGETMPQPPRSGQDVDPKLLEILVCPLTKGPLEYDRERQELISRSARLAYPIRDGIPIMLADDARPLDDAELNK